jgi:hypothetical protein
MARTLKLPCLGFAVILALALAPGSAAAKFTAYQIAHATFDVQEQGSWKPNYKASWEGDGHQHERLMAEDEELPSLPLGIPRRGGHVTVRTDVISDGDETLIDAEGKKEACSGVWNDEDPGTFTVKVQPSGRGKLRSTWEVPTGISSERCGAQFNQLPSPLIVKGNDAGAIGNRRLVLETSGTRTKSRQTLGGKETQTLKWRARVVLVRFGGAKHR